MLHGCSTVKSSRTDDGWVLPQLGSLIPEDTFADTMLPEDEVDRALELVSTSPDEIRNDHQSQYGDSIGNPVDLEILLRKPAIKLTGGILVGISGQLLIQRYTCGLYWDIHDGLPDDATATPNRRRFQTFFGELHERYGRDTLQRVKNGHGQVRRKKKFRLLSEWDYATRGGPNPDNLVIETIGGRNTRCTLFEFKVGRPRYRDSIISGDVGAFQVDLHRKIEDGLNQETDFCRQLLAGQRTIPDLLVRHLSAWLFVIVVTDPFPSMGLFLEPLREKLADASDLGNVKRYGPFILSLAEVEQLETLPQSRVSDLLIDWSAGPHRDWPFNTFYAYRTKGRPIDNGYVSKLADDDLDMVKTTLLGRPVPP